VEGHQGFFLTIGNGGGVELKLNGESLGVPGKVGKVVRLKIPKDAELRRVPKLAQQVDLIEDDLEGAAGDDAPHKQEVRKVPEVGGSTIEDDGFDQ